MLLISEQSDILKYFIVAGKSKMLFPTIPDAVLNSNLNMIYNIDAADPL